MADALQVIESTIFRTTLIGLPEIVALVELDGSPGEYKVFWEDVDESVEFPYVVLTHMAGGFEHKTQHQASDSLWKIVGATVNKNTAVLFANAISQLDRRMPDTTDYPMVVAHHWIEEALPIYERNTIENVPIYRVGGFYRICLSHN